MVSKGFYSAVLSLSAVLTSTALPAATQAETWYGYCWAEKDHSRVCKAPETRGDDFNIKCRDFATEIQGSKWGSRFSTSLSALEADMGQQCDEVFQQPGHLYICNLDIVCPEGSTENPGLHSFGNRVYASDAAKAVERCSDINEHRIVGSVQRFSKADCSLKLVPQVVEN